jgi:hypothetical protein
MFVGNVVVLIVTMVNGQTVAALLPMLGATVTGCAITRMIVVGEKRMNVYDE